MILDIANDGTATCLHSDEIPLQELGTMTIRRASVVEFSGFLQEWEVFTAHEDPSRRERLFHHPSRTVCLQWEHDNWEQFQQTHENQSSGI